MMPEISKFKAITIAFLLMFVFAIAAIYTNTREAAEKSGYNPNKQEKQEYSERLESKRPSFSTNVSELSNRIDRLETRIDEINNSQSSSPTSAAMHCNIQGVMDGDNVVPLSQADAIAEARQAGKELVMLCSFNNI